MTRIFSPESFSMPMPSGEPSDIKPKPKPKPLLLFIIWGAFLTSCFGYAALILSGILKPTATQIMPIQPIMIFGPLAFALIVVSLLLASFLNQGIRSTRMLIFKRR